MATISSHVLDSVIGDHAAGIRVSCYRAPSESGREKLFDVIGNEQGRIAETIDVGQGDGAEYELVFHSAAYWESQAAAPDANQIMETVVVRFRAPTPDAKIHIPVMLSPHSYSVWWSG